MITSLSSSVVFAKTQDNICNTNIEMIRTTQENNLSQELINKDLNEFCNSLTNSTYSEVETTRGKTSSAVKYMSKWLRVNYKIILRKCPKWLRKYIKIEPFIKALDKYAGISDSVEDYVYNVFRYILPKKYVSDWWVKKIAQTIMLCSPL